MIFVTVGTHEQPFDRLIEAIDSLAVEGVVTEPVFIQLGFCTYLSKTCSFEKLISYSEMHKKLQEARIVITHGGDTVFEVLNLGKIPVAVPRDPRFKEHVDDHQIRFVRRLEEMNKVLAVYEIGRLKEIILNYDELARKCQPASLENVERQKLLRNLTSYCQTLRLF